MTSTAGRGGDRPGRPGVPPDWLPGAALAAALLLGPLGIGLGVWWLARRPGESRGRGLAQAAIAVGIVQTLVVGFLLLPGGPARSPAPGSSPDPTNTTWSYPTTPPPNSPRPDGSATPTPIPPTATNLEEFVPATVDSYEFESAGEDPDALDAGAQAAEQGTFDAGDEQIEAGMAEWATPEEAEAHALARAEADFPGEEPIGEGDIRYGAGHWWYYERDGVGTVYWYHGRFSAEFTGTPMEVQEFFLRFPK